MGLLNIVIKASGDSTTAEAALKSTLRGELHGKYRVTGLIASKIGIGAIGKMLRLGLAPDHIAVIDPKEFSTREQFGESILEALLEWGADFFCQYGWLPITPDNVLAKYLGVNQHPAGLDPAPNGSSHPDFGGVGMHGMAAIAAQLYFAKEVSRSFCAEATTHLVGSRVDSGLLVRTNELPINPMWSADDLQQKLLPLEHRTQIEALLQVHEAGALVGHERSARLIYPDEEQTLVQAKKWARVDYPNG